jgi:hypothetical protein
VWSDVIVLLSPTRNQGFGFRVFDGVCLPYQIFCFTKNIRKIHIKVVTEMMQYRKFPNNSSPVEEE